MKALLPQALGLVAIIVGGFLLSVGVGVVACGVVLVYVGLAVEVR